MLKSELEFEIDLLSSKRRKIKKELEDLDTVLIGYKIQLEEINEKEKKIMRNM